MADQRSDRDLGEAKIIRDAGKAVPQDMRCHIPKRRVGQELLPALGEVAHRIVDALAGKDIGAGSRGPLAFQVLDHGQADRAHRRAFLAVDQAQAAAFDVELTPSEIDDLPASAAGNCEDP